MAHPRERIEPSWGQAPVVGQPDPHTEEAGQTLAMVGTTAAATLKQVFEESLDTLSDPLASEQDKARARARLQAGLQFNTTIAQAQDDFAQGRVAQSQLFGQSREGFAQTTTADEFALQASEYFSRSREGLTRASEGLAAEPALVRVLENTGQTINAFFQRVGRGVVSLQALASRALALPGMVRGKIADGIERIEDAVQGSLDDFHAATAKRIDALRDTAAQVAGTVYDTGVALRDGVQSRVDAVVDGVNSKVEAGKTGVAIAGAGIAAVGDTLDSRVVSPLRTWLTETAIPAIKGFAEEFGQEFNEKFEQRKTQRLSLGERLAARQMTGGANPAEPTAKAHGMS